MLQDLHMPELGRPQGMCKGVPARARAGPRCADPQKWVAFRTAVRDLRAARGQRRESAGVTYVRPASLVRYGQQMAWWRAARAPAERAPQGRQGVVGEMLSARLEQLGVSPGNSQAVLSGWLHKRAEGAGRVVR